MKTNKEPQELHVRLTYAEPKIELSQKEIQQRLTRLFILLLEIDQQHKVVKEYHDQ